MKKVILSVLVGISLFATMSTPLTAHANTVDQTVTKNGLRGLWKSQMTGIPGVGTVISETIGFFSDNAEGRASANGSWSAWARPGIPAEARSSRAVSGNTSGWDLRRG